MLLRASLLFFSLFFFSFLSYVSLSSSSCLLGEEEELKKRYVGRWRKEKIFNGGIEKKWVDEEKKRRKKVR